MLPALRSFDRTFADFDRLFRELQGRESGHTKLPLNLYENDDAFVLVAQVPGVQAEDLVVEAEGDLLRLSVARSVSAPEGFKALHRERTPRKASQSLRFRTPIDPEGVSAKLANGLLEITVPKAASARSRRIDIVSS